MLRSLKTLLKEWIQEQRMDVIIAGDVNGRNEVFGDETTTSYGKALLRMLDEENLTAMIPNTPTRPVSNAFLDFFITNNPRLIQPPVTLHVNLQRRSLII